MTSTSCGSRSFVFDLKKKLLGLGMSSLLMNGLCVAQQVSQLPDAPVPQLIAQADQPGTPSQTSATNAAMITIPAGTRLPLVLTHPIDSHSTPKGDEVFAQTTAPVLVGDQVVIPGGTYVQGKVEKLTRNGTRAEMLMQSASLVFPNGYIAQMGGPVNIESEEWTAWSNPHGGAKAAIILAPLLGIGLGMGIGAATDKPHTINAPTLPPPPPGFPPLPPLPPLPPITENTHKGLAIGGIVGGIAGGITGLVLAERNHEFYIQEGSAAKILLPKALPLSQDQVSAANQAAANAPPPPVPQRPIIQGQAGPSSPAPNSGPASCSAGQEWCQGQCVDGSAFLNDSQNCGRCGNSCSFSESCTGGSCSCAPGYSSCMGQCTSDASFMSDNQNCGRCGNSCAIGESCLGGSCRKM
ncbi:MAG TPA: hypothetical protein VJO35_00180 [Terriglobales bacterium]|nr:hypothetical protein [Terriglobales bacterium]